MKKSAIKTTVLFVPVILLAMVLFTTTTQSCKKTETTATTLTLYDSLGGTTLVQDPNAATGTMIEKGRLGIRSVVDSAIFVIAADTAINGFFTVLLSEVTTGNTSGLTALSKNLTDFFCTATGAKDYTYTGKNMVDAHNPATNPRMNGKAEADDFDAFVNDLVISCNKNGLPTYLITRLGTVVGTLKTQVVQQ